jgi:hypothetical protein
MNAFDLLFFYSGKTFHKMFDNQDNKSVKDEYITSFTTTCLPPETLETIKTALEKEQYTKVNVHEDINKIRSEHYNRK